MIYWCCMPTKKDILNFAVDKDLMKRLDDFRFENRINTMSKAIRRLLDEALKKYEKKAEKIAFSRGCHGLSNNPISVKSGVLFFRSIGISIEV